MSVALPFNGDRFVAEEVAALCKKHKIQTIIECGTYLGDTTPYLASLADRVVTIEIRKDFFARGEHLNAFGNVVRVLGDTVNWFRNPGALLDQPSFSLDVPTLIFVDSHWGVEWPILRELEGIASLHIRPVLVIHDFYVPGSSLGFDEYGGHRLDLEYVTPGMDAIYGAGGWTHHYNDNEHAEGSRRGVLYVEPNAQDSLREIAR